MTRALLLAAAVAAVAPRALADSVDVTAQLDQDVAGTDQTITLTVAVTIHGNGDVERMQFPRSSHFAELGRTESTQSSFSLSPSGMDVSRTTIFRLSLQPKDPGDYDLPPALAVVSGKTYRSGPVHVRIVPAGHGPRQPQAQQSPFVQNPFGAFGFPNPFPDQGEDPFQDLFGGGRPPTGQDVFLAAGVDHHGAYLGQQVTYSIRLYTRVDVSEFDGLKLPGFDGFWGEDLDTPTHPVPTLQNVGGVPYQVFLLKKKALFPDHAGDLTIGPAEVDIAAGGLFFRGHKVHRSSGAVAVHVLPLPAGAPAGFSTSNVGEWNLSAALKPASVPVGEPATLTLVAQGSGNLHALDLPRLPAIPGLRAYDPTSSDKAAPSGDRFGGTRKVEIVLIGQRTGDFVMPALSFSYFDPATHAYQTQTTPPLHLLVSAGTTAGGGGPSGAQNVLEASYRPLRPAPALAAHRLPPLEGRALWILLAAPPLLFSFLAAVEALRRRRRDAAPELRMRQAYRVARRRLRAAKGLLGGPTPDRALAEITGALIGYLEDRAGEKVAGLSHGDLADRLRALGANGQAAASAVSALEACEAERYAPGAGGKGGKDLLSRVEFAIDALERSDWKPARRAA